MNDSYGIKFKIVKEVVVMRNKKNQHKQSSEQKSHKKGKVIRKQISYFISSFILTLAVAYTVVSVIVVDKNSRKIGWSDQKATLAFSSNNKRMDFSIAGSNLNLDLTLFNKAQEIIADLQTSYNQIKPVPNKLSDEVVMFLEPQINDIFKIIYYNG
jgi:hypothetical protein